jgi:hypothetical protein
MSEAEEVWLGERETEKCLTAEDSASETYEFDIPAARADVKERMELCQKVPVRRSVLMSRC